MGDGELSNSQSGGTGCPFCGASAVARVWIARPELDACSCHRCGRSWDEDPSGAVMPALASGASWPRRRV